MLSSRLAVLPLLTLAVLATSCRTTGSQESSSNTKDIQDIAAVTPNGTQGMTVVCKDATTFSYSFDEFQQKVADNTICDGGSSGGGQGEYMCIAYNQSTSQIAKVSNGNTIGTNFPNQDCYQAIAASRDGLVCAAYNNETSQIYNGKTQQMIGTNLKHAACNGLVKASRNNLICEPYNSDTSQILKLVNNQNLGTNVDHGTCGKLVNAQRGDFICVPYNLQTSQLTRLSTNQALGTNIAHADCMQSIPQ